MESPTLKSRPHTIYIGATLSKCYRLLALKLGRKSSEDVIEEVLMAALENTHPDILKHVRGQEEAEEAFRKQITPAPRA